ncbi:MAG: helix-turn-helix transcriptional regulator [Polyangiaceae bacterium]|nr:helix-turn-helix transcriptional regulator [Polyangiaceae bacterium]
MASEDGAGVLRSVAANVRAIRRRRDLTQAALAERADLEVRQLQRVESGKMDCGIVALAAIAAALEVPIGRLFRVASLPAPTRGRPRRSSR